MSEHHTLWLSAPRMSRERLFEDVTTSQFPLEDEDFFDIGNKLQSLGESFEEAKIDKLLEDL
jgi:hypothetical protein